MPQLPLTQYEVLRKFKDAVTWCRVVHVEQADLVCIVEEVYREAQPTTPQWGS